MKEEYISPEIKIVLFETEDIITTSSTVVNLPFVSINDDDAANKDIIVYW